MRTVCILALLIYLLPGVACRHRGDVGAVDAQESKPPAITAEPLRIPEVERLIAAQQGKVTVVDLWALW